LRLDPVTNRNDDIQAVEGHRLGRTSNMHFLHIAGSAKFSVIENIANMAGKYGLVPLKQLSHLGLVQPDGFLCQLHLKGSLPVFLLINDDFAVFLFHFIRPL